MRELTKSNCCIWPRNMRKPEKWNVSRGITCRWRRARRKQNPTWRTESHRSRSKVNGKRTRCHQLFFVLVLRTGKVYYRLTKTYVNIRSYYSLSSVIEISFRYLIVAALKEYDLLMDDMIDFVQAVRMPPHDSDKKREESPPPHVKTLQTIQETKKSLPIYPFRNDLVQAIKDHQVNMT